MKAEQIFKSMNRFMLQLRVMLVEQVVEDAGTAAKNNQTDEQNYHLYFHITIYNAFSESY